MKTASSVLSLQRRRTSMTLFIVLAFAIPWAGWIAAQTIAKSTPYARWLFYFGDGCSVAGLIATWYATGSKGLIDLLKRAINPVAPIFWWIYAIAIPVLWLMFSTILYGIFWGGIGHVDIKAFSGFITVPALLFWLTGSLGEEFGWRGFFLPRLLRNASPLKAAIIVGAIWAIWHAPLYYKQWMASPLRGFNFLIGVISFSIFLAALYIGSKGNILLCMFMHWMINASQIVIGGVFPDIRFTSELGIIQLVVQIVLTAAVIWRFKLFRSTLNRDDDDEVHSNRIA